MRTARSEDRSASDLTARARIRDAAVECFAESGFDAPFRAIAARAGVSPGLITHHFATKAALRAECDREVLARYLALKSQAIGDPSGYLFAHLAAPGASADMLVYMLRAIHAGGPGGRAFLESLIEEAEGMMAEAVATGMVRPSRDEHARTRLLAHQTMGALLLQLLAQPDATPEEFVASLQTAQRDSILPTLEIYTEGLMTSSTMLDDYVAYLEGRPAAPARDDDGAAGSPAPTA